MNWIKRNRKICRLYIVLLFIAILVEVFVFNLSAVRSIRNGEGIEITDRFSVSEEAVYNAENNLYTMSGEEFSMYINEVNADIMNLYVGIDFSENIVSDRFYLTDEGNSEPYGLSERHLLNGKAKKNSRYVSLYPYGKVKTIKIVFRAPQGSTFRIERIVMNPRKPFNIRFSRLLVIYSVFVLIALVRKKSRIHQIYFDKNSRKQLVAGVILMLISLIGTTVVYRSNADFWKNNLINTEYYELTKSLSQGKATLNYEVSPELLALENPYDYYARSNCGGDAVWDASFYKGKYYCYFGVIPVMLVYLPYYLLTGEMIENCTVNLLFSLLIVMGSFYLIRGVILKWGNGKMPFFAWPFFSILICFSENLFYLYMRPSFYNIPIVAANAFSLWGLGFWIRGTITEKIRMPYYFAGSLCLAFVAGCRPQMVLISVLAIPLYWDLVIKDRRLFSKDSWKETLAICLPYIVTAVFLMYYNYIRFGNVFDFGAQYNLTTNDMTKRGFNVERLGCGIYTLLFQPPNIIATFPFVQETLISSHYMGKIIVEFVLGGIFTVNIITWINFMAIGVKDILKKYKVWYFIETCLGLVMVLCCIDVSIAGILQRYTADMALMALLPACIMGCILLDELGERKSESYYILSHFITAALVLMLFFDGFMMFTHAGEHNIYEGNQELYYYVEDFFNI